MAASHLLTPALIARSVDYGETDRILTLLTETGGKISALARGARRSRKRFGAALSLFVLGRAELVAPRREGALWRLERFEAMEDLGGRISVDLGRVTHGSYILEVTRELWPSEAHEPAIFGLVIEALRAVAATSPSPSLLRSFELGLLKEIGLAPSFDRCVDCGAVISDDAPGPFGFSATSGGIICGGCGAHGWPLTAATRREAKVLTSMPPLDAAERQPDLAVARALREMLMLLIRHHVGRELHAWQFLSQMAGDGG